MFKSSTIFSRFSSIRFSLVSEFEKISFNNDDLKTAVNSYFSEQSNEFYLNGIRALRPRYEKCINADGQYFGK